MSTTRLVRVVAAAALILLVSCSDDDPSATATLVAPTDGATVAGGVPLTMSAEGVTIEEAGTARADAGHFHVIADEGCLETGAAIPKDADHVHFGKGQSEGMIYLEPGTHELCLQVGDGVHAAQAITDTANVDVGVTSREQWCDVVDQVDRLFDEVDNSDAELEVKQVEYENIRRLAAQLDAGMDQVDDDARSDVQASIDFATEVAGAFIGAEDMLAAQRALEPVLESQPEALEGAPWILETCGVDIDG